MPYYDLNTVYKPDLDDLADTLTFQHELGYNTIAVSIPVTGQLTNTPPPVLVSNLKRLIPPKLQILTRMTLTISDTSQNHRINALQSLYDIIALRPTTEKTFQLCCSSLECDLISLDLSQRLPFILRFTTAASALQRGIRFEICYSTGIINGTDARRNLISGAANLIRATRGRGIIISSEARNALGIRAPSDVINLAQVWGLSQERGKESVCEEAGKVIRYAALKRTSFRGVVDIIDGGNGELSGSKHDEARKVKPNVAATVLQPLKQKQMQSTEVSGSASGTKRKASSASLDISSTLPTAAIQTIDDGEKPLSKREMKRRAKKARKEDNQTKPARRISNTTNAKS